MRAVVGLLLKQPFLHREPADRHIVRHLPDRLVIRHILVSGMIPKRIHRARAVVGQILPPMIVYHRMASPFRRHVVENIAGNRRAVIWPERREEVDILLMPDLCKQSVLVLVRVRIGQETIERGRDDQLVKGLRPFSSTLAHRHINPSVIRTLHLHDLRVQVNRVLQLSVDRLVDALGPVLPGPEPHCDELDGRRRIEILHDIGSRDFIEEPISEGGKGCNPDLLDILDPVLSAEFVKRKRQVLQVRVHTADPVERPAFFLGKTGIPPLRHADMTIQIIALVLRVHDLHELLHLALHPQEPG